MTKCEIKSQITRLSSFLLKRRSGGGIWYFFVLFIILIGCQKDPVIQNLDDGVYQPTPYTIEIPNRFPDMNIPVDNPTTAEGVALGKMLFFDPILSGDSSLSCAGCHKPQNSFSDDKKLSFGIHGTEGKRNTMPLINVGWLPVLDWTGKFSSLEDQAIDPVMHPLEMNITWEELVAKINKNDSYVYLFKNAFPNQDITKELVTKAIAQFERTLISSNSKFDQALKGDVALTDEEIDGYLIFNTEKGDCFHCHGVPEANLLLTDNDFHNNGLDAIPTDSGRSLVTGDPSDYGKFKTPTLRNIEYTAPYMHDGRFNTLEEVIDFYSEGIKRSPTIDPLMKKIDQGGIGLTEEEKSSLIAFLKTLSDPSYID